MVKNRRLQLASARILRLQYSLGIAAAVCSACTSGNNGDKSADEPNDTAAASDDTFDSTEFEDSESESFAEGISITHVEANQGVATYVLERGIPVPVEERSIGIIEARTLLLRAYWERGPGFRNREITAQLTLRFADGTKEVRPVTRRVAMVSNSDDEQSTFSWLIEKERVQPKTTYQITLKEADPAFSGTTSPGPGAMVPSGEPADLGVIAGDTVLKIVMVPFSPPGGTPVSISETDKRTVENTLLELSAVARVEVTWRAPVVQEAVYTDTGEPWSVISALRESDGAGPEVYYHALLNKNGCCEGDEFKFSGLGGYAGDTASAADVWARCALIPIGDEGVGRAVVPIVHELGHNQGRQHAPCGDGEDPDPDFPYANGGVGRQGYGVVSGELYSADTKIARPYKDIMGYCLPAWYSDYNFEAIRVRAKTLSARGEKRELFVTKVPVLLFAISRNGISHRFSMSARPAEDACATYSGDGIRAVYESPSGTVPLCVEEIGIPDHPLVSGVVYLPEEKNTTGGRVTLLVGNRTWTFESIK